jgi:hypothetical protein
LDQSKFIRKFRPKRFLEIDPSVWIKTALTSAIYRKSLTVSSSGKKDTTTGEVVNLMSVDTQKVVEAIVSSLFFNY